jgi:hypothetical protein
MAQVEGFEAQQVGSVLVSEVEWETAVMVQVTELAPVMAEEVLVAA